MWVCRIDQGQSACQQQNQLALSATRWPLCSALGPREMMPVQQVSHQRRQTSRWSMALRWCGRSSTRDGSLARSISGTLFWKMLLSRHRSWSSGQCDCDENVAHFSSLFPERHVCFQHDGFVLLLSQDCTFPSSHPDIFSHTANKASWYVFYLNLHFWHVYLEKLILFSFVVVVLV